MSRDAGERSGDGVETIPAADELVGEGVAVSGAGGDFSSIGDGLSREGEKFSGDAGELFGIGAEAIGTMDELSGDGEELSGDAGELFGIGAEAIGTVGELSGDGEKLPGDAGELFGIGAEVSDVAEELLGDGDEAVGDGVGSLGGGEDVFDAAKELSGDGEDVSRDGVPLRADVGTVRGVLNLSMPDPGFLPSTPRDAMLTALSAAMTAALAAGDADAARVAHEAIGRSLGRPAPSFPTFRRPGWSTWPRSGSGGPGGRAPSVIRDQDGLLGTTEERVTIPEAEDHRRSSSDWLDGDP